MSGPREFIIQRYSTELWPQIRGRMPFIVSGPRFFSVVVPGSLDRHGEHRLTPEFKKFLSEELLGPRDRRPELAELLLREAVLLPLWSVDGPELAPLSERWDRSIVQVCREIPGGDVPLWAAEYLAGMGGPEHYTSILGTDGLRLESIVPPPLG